MYANTPKAKSIDSIYFAADPHRYAQTITIFCLGDPPSLSAMAGQVLPRQKFHMPFRHKLDFYREAIGGFSLRRLVAPQRQAAMDRGGKR